MSARSTTARLIAVATLTVSFGSAPRAASFDPTPLPQTCRDSLAGMQSDKARFGALGKVMAQSRKASNTENFCKAARETIEIIKSQSDRLDYCIGDLSSAKDVPQSTADQMFQLRTVYKQMLDAAKDAKNDRFKCGLADL